MVQGPGGTPCPLCSPSQQRLSNQGKGGYLYSVRSTITVLMFDFLCIEVSYFIDQFSMHECIQCMYLGLCKRFQDKLTI